MPRSDIKRSNRPGLMIPRNHAFRRSDEPDQVTVSDARWQTEEVRPVVHTEGANHSHFLYFYIPGPDNGEELKLSIRSIEKYVDPKAHVTVLGDRPRWYTGHHIHCPSVRHARGDPVNRTPFRDTHAKIMVAARHTEIPERFCWIMDDTYFLRPTTLEDLSIGRDDQWWKPPRGGSEWHRLISRTHSALKAKGYPTKQYGTHLPHVFEKPKLLQMFEEFNFGNNLLLFEVLYGNRWYVSDTTYVGFLKRWLTVPNATQLNGMEEHVLNYVSSVWRTTMKNWLHEKFPDRSRFEA